MYTSAWQSLVMRLRRTRGVWPMASRMLLHFMARLASTLAVRATDLGAARRNSSRHCQIVSCGGRRSGRARRRAVFVWRAPVVALSLPLFWLYVVILAKNPSFFGPRHALEV